MTKADLIRTGAVATVTAGIVSAVLIGLMSRPEPVKPKPAPTEKPSMQWFLDANGPNGLQAGRDLQSLGKYGIEHDRWILQKYGPPKPTPTPKPRPPRAGATSQDG